MLISPKQILPKVSSSTPSLPGETLYSIARMYNVSPQSIIALNPEAKNGIKAGAVLIIPQNYAYQKTEKTSSDNNQYVYHTVIAKETYYFP